MAGAALAVSVVAGQTLDNRVADSRLRVPPISERIEIRPIEDQVGSFSGLRAPVGARIYGIVMNELGFVVPSAGTLIVRSLNDGQAVAHTTVDIYGQFEIRSVNSGMYTAELISRAGSLLTSSPAFTIRSGEVVHLTPVIPQSSFGGLHEFLASGTSSAMSAAISAGILTVAPLPAVSPE